MKESSKSNEAPEVVGGSQLSHPSIPRDNRKKVESRLIDTSDSGGVTCMTKRSGKAMFSS
jgi:hypothetical protein